jgi:hypothetical protein
MASALHLLPLDLHGFDPHTPRPHPTPPPTRGNEFFIKLAFAYEATTQFRVLTGSRAVLTSLCCLPWTWLGLGHPRPQLHSSSSSCSCSQLPVAPSSQLPAPSCSCWHWHSRPPSAPHSPCAALGPQRTKSHPAVQKARLVGCCFAFFFLERSIIDNCHSCCAALLFFTGRRKGSRRECGRGAARTGSRRAAVLGTAFL